MDGVMTRERAEKVLAESSAVFAHLGRTSEPVDLEQIFEERMVRHKYMRETKTTAQNCVGGCVLKAVSRFVYGSDAYSAYVRRIGLAMLIVDRDEYERHVVDEDWNDYIRRVSREDEDVDLAFLYAITDAYALRIIELVPYKHHCIAEYIPLNKLITQTIRIATYVHSDAMYPIPKLKIKATED